MTNQFD